MDRHIEFDPRYVRPAEVDMLRGDASKARTALAWTPKVDFDALMDMMIASDLALAARERTLEDAGHGPT
jgi:GDPmannose 4,6-dehydratase